MSLGSLGGGLKFLFACVALCASPIETADENLPQFKVFCGIYNLIKEPDQKVKSLGNETRVKAGQLVREVEKLVVVTAPTSEETEIRKTIEKEEPNWSLEEVDDGQGRRIRRYEAVRANDPAVKAANKKIRRILEAVKKIYDKFKNEDKKLLGVEDGIRKKLKRALSGNDEGTIDAKSFGGTSGSTSRKNSCSHNAAGKGGGPGKSLVNDVFCLCGEKNTGTGSTSASQACGAGIRDEANWGTKSGTDDKLPTDPQTNFPKIMEQCPGDKGAHITRLGDISRAVMDFDGMLGKVAASPDAALAWQPFHFGKGHASADGACEGDADNEENVCVNYKAVLTGTGAGIAWRTSLLEAEKDLQEAARLAGDLRRMEEGLEHLCSLAWSAYEHAVPASGDTQSDSAKFKAQSAQSHHVEGGNASTKSILNDGPSSSVTEKRSGELPKTALLFSIMLA